MTLKEAAAWAGGRTELARRLGISSQAVYKWGREIPMLRQYEIRELSGGALEVSTLESKSKAA